MAQTIDLRTPKVFEPLLYPSRYKAVYGGRGGGKSHFFAEGMVEEALSRPGFRAVCIREVQKSLAQSSKQLIETKIQELGVGAHFTPLKAEIGCPGGGVILFQGMQDHTAETIKSLEGVDVAWIEEAQSLSRRSWEMLRPTIRKDGSEIWAGWNPRLESDAVDEFFRKKTPANAIVVQANWDSNPFFPAVLDEERRLDLKLYPDRYPHVWEGDYVRALEGAYFARDLAIARAEGRFLELVTDPILPVYAFWDLGGSGHTADAMAIWVIQIVGEWIHCLDYIEGSGQVLAYYVNEMRSRGWGRAICVLPHDAAQDKSFVGVRFEDLLRQAEFEAHTIPNQGRGAAMLRVSSARRVFNRVKFDSRRTEAGVAALGWYHEKRDPDRRIGLGPDHDWSSHGADAFGLMAVVYETRGRGRMSDAPRRERSEQRRTANSVTGY